jgi:CII-binding regulator of phage lambda lysogenization HflD
METLIIITSPLVLLLVAWLVKTLLTKFKVDINTQILALTLVKTAVERVEKLALETGYKGPEKLSVALSIIDKLAKENPQVVEYIKGKEKELVEGVLKSSLTEASMTPKETKDA